MIRWDIAVRLVAEDVEKVNPDLVVRDKEENPYSVRYDQVNAMLLNEFLKEHRTVADEKTTVALQLKLASDGSTTQRADRSAARRSESSRERT